MIASEPTNTSASQPLLAAEVNTSEMLLSRAIFLAAFLGLAILAGFVGRSNGPWLKTLVYGLVFLTPLGIGLFAEMRFPRKIWLLDRAIRIALWHRSPFDIPYQHVKLSFDGKGVRIIDGSGSTRSRRAVKVPRSFPSFDDIVEVLEAKVDGSMRARSAVP